MYEQIKALKEGQSVGKPIYNHVSGLLDPPEEIKSPQVCLLFCTADRKLHRSGHILSHSPLLYW